MASTKRWPKGTWMELKDREALAAQMAEKNLSLDKLAWYAGCSKGMISHLVAGRRRTCTPLLATRISGALGVSVTLLFVPKVSTAQGRNVPGGKTPMPAAA